MLKLFLLPLKITFEIGFYIDSKIVFDCCDLHFDFGCLYPDNGVGVGWCRVKFEVKVLRMLEVIVELSRGLEIGIGF